MVNNILKNRSPSKIFTEEIKIIYFYRYFSLIVTSLFYLLNGYEGSLYRKIIVVTCLSLSSIILNQLYIKNQAMKKVMKILIIMETLGNTLLLIPTGGLGSPYIWYSLNTVLISVFYLNIYYCSVNLLLYLIISSTISFVIFNTDERSIIQIFFKNSNLILSFILITVATQLLSTLTKQLKKESINLNLLNNELKVSKDRVKESMEHILALYQAVHYFINQKHKDKLINIITQYTREITKTDFSFFCLKSPKGQWEVVIDGEAPKNFKHNLVKELNKQWREDRDRNKIITFWVENKKYLSIIIKYSYKQYGILGIEVNVSELGVLYKDIMDELSFLSELSSIVLERMHLEELNEHLLITEEQNRIANEIHDNISQKLFSLSCATHNLKYKLKQLPLQGIENELGTINECLNNTMKELRETVYGLSSRKKGISMFKQDITNYINDTSKFHGISIAFNMKGNEELIPRELKRALYRIICEATGNAINHGKCTIIEISLNITKVYTELKIIDNGIGFSLKGKMKNKELGLGIENMHNLVSYLNGKITIDSKLEIGTIINIILPNQVLSNKNQGKVYESINCR